MSCLADILRRKSMEMEEMEKRLKGQEEAIVLMARNIMHLFKIVEPETYEKVAKLYMEKKLYQE